jgi:hypothetical protein
MYPVSYKGVFSVAYQVVNLIILIISEEWLKRIRDASKWFSVMFNESAELWVSVHRGIAHPEEDLT